MGKDNLQREYSTGIIKSFNNTITSVKFLYLFIFNQIFTFYNYLEPTNLLQLAIQENASLPY
jgi:hypothetical protein